MITSFVNADDSLSLTVKAQGGTGFKINDIRTFKVTEDTLFKEDGNIIPETKAQGGTGYKTRYKVSDTNPNFTSGQLEEIDLINIYKGPLLSVSPIQIFNISGLINGNTYYANNLTVDGLEVGDSVLVSGYLDNNSLAVITRIEVVSDLSVWKISGYVDNLSANQFTIHNQLVSFSPEDIGSCASSFADHVFVEVTAEPVAGFKLNDIIETVTQINCVDRSVIPGIPFGAVIIEGMIDGMNQDGGFVLAGQNVEVDQFTRYIRGRVEDIQERIKVEVEGTVDNSSGVVTADKIRFLEARINLTLPVRPNDFNSPLLNLAGVDLQLTPQTLDPDGVILGGFIEAKQLQLKGYDYGASDLIVTKIYERGSVDYDDVSVEGEISAVDRPMIEVFGIKIDGSDSLFYDAEGINIHADVFFEMISVNAKILVENSTLNVQSGLISGGTISIDELVEIKNFNTTASKIGESTLVGVGRITSLLDAIFKAEFE